ncbi:MAG: polysaccharide biosynthesis protein [uncultured bacterium]|nr:MAG: polysaccharide biosynthesis protein [uncultured bacterium]HBR71542.1 hypothetical protein [Candidatus Moranbacteria bacterium]
MEKIIRAIHINIFGHEMSDAMRIFLKNLSWSFFGGISAALIMFVLSVMAGKTLGPDAFGQYNSLLSFATALTFLFLMGNDVSSVRYLADNNYEKNKGEIFTTSIVLVLVQSFVFGLFFYIFFNFVRINFSLESDSLLLGIIFSFFLAIKSLFDGYLRAFNLIKRQSFIRISDAILVICFFYFFYYFLDKSDYYFYAISVLFGSFFFISASLIALRGNLRKFSFKMAKLLFGYNKFLIFGAAIGFIISLEKYFIGKYVGAYELGVYSAYHAASFLIISNIGAVFMNVFWPSSIMEKNNLEAILKKINILFLKAFPFWIILNSLFILLVIFLMGESYPLNYVYIVFFSIDAFLSFAFSIFNGLLKINRIKEFVIMSYLCYSSLIILIILSRNVMYYLVGQVFIYSIFILFANKRLGKDFVKNNEVIR